MLGERESEDIAIAAMMLEHNGRAGDTGMENYRFRRLLQEYPAGRSSSLPSFFRERQLNKYSGSLPAGAR